MTLWSGKSWQSGKWHSKAHWIIALVLPMVLLTMPACTDSGPVDRPGDDIDDVIEKLVDRADDNCDEDKDPNC